VLHASDYVMYHTVIPISPSECKVTCSWLFLKDNNDQYNQNDAIEFWDKTNKQDWNISELSQLGIKSKNISLDFTQTEKASFTLLIIII